MRRIAAGLLALALLAGCGGDAGGDPVQQVPDRGGLREKLRTAGAPKEADFPSPQGKTLEQLSSEVAAGPELGLASSIFRTGENRLAFGVIDEQGQFVYGSTAVYVARTPQDQAQGPFLAPADLLVTEPPFRSRQAATEEDPFAAVYAAQVAFPEAGSWSVLAITNAGGRQIGTPGEIRVIRPERDRIPAVGDRAPKVQTDTVASAKGDVEAIDTRVPPSDMHDKSFADVVGSKPVALLFSTPQLCQSRVCGPVTDIALQLKSKYGDRVEFIHQEVYVDNDPNRGLREPLRRFNLPTEPWLFVVGADGRITARLEGSFGLQAFERALQTAL